MNLKLFKKIGKKWLIRGFKSHVVRQRQNVWFHVGHEKRQRQIGVYSEFWQLKGVNLMF